MGGWWRTAALLSGLAAFFGASVPASVAAVPDPLFQMGSQGEGAAQLNNPRGIAADPVTGHVFVVESANRRVSEFTPWGDFVKAFGWDVAPGAVNEQQEVRVRATSGQFKLSFGPDTTADLAHDASAAEVEAALTGLASIGPGGVVVTLAPAPDGATPSVYVITFKGALAATDVAELAAANGAVPLGGGSPATELEVRTRATGTGAAAALETCTTESGCKAGLAAGNGVGQLNNPLGLAMDSGGDLYVVDFTNRRVQKFSQEGKFLLMFGGNVDKGPNHPGNLCTAQYVAEGDNCSGVATTGAGEAGRFEAWVVGAFIAVDSADRVYVGDKNRIQRFSSGGVVEPAGEISLVGYNKVTNLAIDGAGNFYLTSESQPGVRKLLPNGTPVGSPYPLETSGAPKALAADSAGNLFVTRTTGSPDVIAEYDAGGVAVGTFGAPAGTVELGNGAGANIACVGSSAPGDVYASNFKSGAGAASYVSVFGPPPSCFEAPPMVAPSIDSQYASAVGTTEATLRAQINPHFWPDASYYVEYGTGKCSEGACTERVGFPRIPLGGAPQDASILTSPLALKGLAPATTYHYRFVTESGGGGPVLGLEQALTTFPMESRSLADGRAYEMVSPAGENDAEVGVPSEQVRGGVGGLVNLSVIPQQASPSGEAITYASFTAFDDPESAPGASQYLSRRSPSGWSTENITPAFEEGSTRDPLVGFSADLSRGMVISRQPTLVPADPALEGFENLYMRDNADGSLDLLSYGSEVPRISIPKPEYCVSYGGATPGFDRVLFSARGGITPEAIAGNGHNLYEWSQVGGLRLVSLLPGPGDGSPAPPSAGTGFGRGAPGGCNMAFGKRMRQAISVDGSRVFWTYGGTFSGNERPLFARVGGTETVQLDATQGGVGPGGRGEFAAASADGSRVFFTDTQKLTPDSNAGTGNSDLYLYDFEEPIGERLTNLTPVAGGGRVEGVLGASDSGSHVYFVAKSVLSGSQENSEGDTAVPSQNNLYVLRPGETPRFIGTLGTSGDPSNWDQQMSKQTARVTPDGLHLAFLSNQSLTGYDSTIGDGSSHCALSGGAGQPEGPPECTEAFLYDFEVDRLVCASCNPSGARPLGPPARGGLTTLPAWPTPYEQPRYLSDDGGRLFFGTVDPLLPRDINGKRDVYEFEQVGVGDCTVMSSNYVAESSGCLSLVSTGVSADDSYFLDASASARDVFISTRQRLVPSDEDDHFDVYDAREGGGFAVPDVPRPCTGESCRPTVPAPTSPAPGSSSFSGDGNLEEAQRKPRCPKGKRAVKRRGGKRCVKQKHRKQREARRGHGRADR